MLVVILHIQYHFQKMSLCFRALTKQNHIVVLRELLVHMTCDIILKRTNNSFLCIEGKKFCENFDVSRAMVEEKT